MARTTKELMEIAWEIAREYGINHVKEKAREILDKHPEFIEFVVEDYNVYFTKSVDIEAGGQTGAFPGQVHIDEVPDAEELEKFIQDWDDRLEITGHDMRVKKTAPAAPQETK